MFMVIAAAIPSVTNIPAQARTRRLELAVRIGLSLELDGSGIFQRVPGFVFSTPFPHNAVFVVKSQGSITFAVPSWTRA